MIIFKIKKCLACMQSMSITETFTHSGKIKNPGYAKKLL
ncbi:hypothetical protein N748_00590 [Legionella pneumophila str. 121004]|nr:hypothetical protein N748_00590 [Legionella pneumophila str. 121004]ERH42575.1 hypothetical protein N751_02730 [Legionella pneumophila str. Leg01/11]ERH46926.1 hypothetical protein N750_00355 [Legionella pneumophila str. Leg01/53]ERI48357.1 hypothetical protein N749_09855 [Legionella pneumophila str. Leg01/20]